MSDWTPSDAQIEAARDKAEELVTKHFRYPGDPGSFHHDVQALAEGVLHAAHAAAPTVDTTDRALADVSAERRRQNETWGVQRHGWGDWIAILGEEFGEASREAVDITFGRCDDVAALRNELIHLAAVAVQIVEHIDSDTAR